MYFFVFGYILLGMLTTIVLSYIDPIEKDDEYIIPFAIFCWPLLLIFILPTVIVLNLAKRK